MIFIDQISVRSFICLLQYFFKQKSTIENKEVFLTGLKKQKMPDLAEVFNKEGQEGWLVIQVLTPDLAQGMWSAKTGNFVALLQREII